MFNSQFSSAENWELNIGQIFVRWWLPGSDDQRSAKCEIQLGFRWNIQLFAFGQHLNCGGASGSNASADSRALAAAGDRTDCRTDTGADSGALGSLTAAAFSGFLIFRCCKRIRNAVDDNLSQLEPEFSLSSDAAGLINVGDTPANVGTAGNDFHAALIERLIEHGDEC